jgi:hypothetical protein
MEIEHLRVACEMMRRYEGMEAEEILPAELPEPTLFQENKDYVRQVLAGQVDLRAIGAQFIPLDQMPEDAKYFEYQRAVNGGGFVPSEQVIDDHIAEFGGDYRDMPGGPHPVEQQQQPSTRAAGGRK